MRLTPLYLVTYERALLSYEIVSQICKKHNGVRVPSNNAHGAGWMFETQQQAIRAMADIGDANERDTNSGAGRNQRDSDRRIGLELPTREDYTDIGEEPTGRYTEAGTGPTSSCEAS